MRTLQRVNSDWNPKEDKLEQKRKVGSLLDFGFIGSIEAQCGMFGLAYRLFFLRSIAQFFTWIYVHELFCQFISWKNWVTSGKFMDNCCISCQVMADMEIFYNDLININLYWLQGGVIRKGSQNREIIQYWGYLGFHQ